MRILFVTDKFAPEHGGTQNLFAGAYGRLEGHEVTVVTRRHPEQEQFDGAFPHRIVRVPFSPIPKLRSPLLWLRLMRTAARLAEKEPFDQLHCGQAVETAPWGTRLARRLGVPSVVHTFAEELAIYSDHPAYGRLMRQALRSAAAVTTVSRYTRERLLKLGVSSDRVVLLYPGVDPDAWAPAGREREIHRRYGLEGKRVILTLGRLIPRKGHDTVLRALPRVASAVPDVRYLIAGTGPDEPRLRSLVERLGLADRVCFAGSIPETEKVDYYQACDVFAMPNRQLANGDVEGFGIVFLEANACGKPVVGGRSGGTEDAVADGETGWLVDPEDPDSAAERLIALLTDETTRRRLGERGAARVRERFTWKHSALALEQAVSLAGRRHSAARGAAAGNQNV